jgi:hypothetical protein
MNDFLPRSHDGCDHLCITVVDTNIIVAHIQVHSLVAEFFGKACTIMEQSGVDRAKAFQVTQGLPNPLDRSATLPQRLDDPNLQQICEGEADRMPGFGLPLWRVTSLDQARPEPIQDIMIVGASHSAGLFCTVAFQNSPPSASF